MKLFKKALALFLSIIMLFSAAPISGFSIETNNSEATDTVKTNVDSKKVRIVDEVEEMRDEFTKVYSLEDGKFCEIKSGTPIHVKKGSQWVNPIDVDLPEKVENISSSINPLIDANKSEQSSSKNRGLSAGGNRDGDGDPQIPDSGENEDFSYNFAKESSSVDECISNNCVFLLKDDNLPARNANELTYSYTMTIDISEDSPSTDVDTTKIFAFAVDTAWQQQATLSFDTFNYIPDLDYVAPEPEPNEDPPENPNERKYNVDVVDIQAYDDDGQYDFDATNIFYNWTSGLNDNYGLAFVANSDAAYTVNDTYYSTRIYESLAALNPETTYHTVDMGSMAGMLFIDDYLNIAHIMREEFALETNTLNADIKRLVTPVDFDNTGFYGDNTYFNYHSRLIHQGSTYTWNSINGESVTFVVTDNSTTVADTTGLGYTINVSSKQITGSDGMIYKFNSNTLYITSVIDPYENELTISYATSNGEKRISYIEEKDAGRRYQFGYSSVAYSFGGDQFSRSVLTSITVKQKNANRRYETVQVDGVDLALNYEYVPISSSTIALSNISYPDGSVYHYDYTSSGEIAMIVCDNGNRLTLDYSGNVAEYTLTEEDGTITKSNRARNYSALVGYLDEVPVTGNTSQYETRSELSIDNRQSFRRVFTDENGNVVETRYNRQLQPEYVVDEQGNTYIVDYSNQTVTTTRIGNHSQYQNGVYDDNFNIALADSEWYVADEYSDADVSYEIESLSYNEESNNVLKIKGNGIDDFALSTIVDVSDSAADDFIVDADAYLNTGSTLENNYAAIRVYACDSDGEVDDIDAPLYELSFGEWYSYEKQHKCGYFSVDPNDPIEYFRIDVFYSGQYNPAYIDNISIIADNDNIIEISSQNSGQSQSNSLQEYNTLNSHGLPVEHVLSDGSNIMVEKLAYDSTAPFNTTSRTDYNNISTTYNYDTPTGLLLSKQTGGSTTSYSYNPIGLLKSVQTVANGLDGNPVTVNNLYTYANQNISSITHGDLRYSFTYDSYGKIKSVNQTNLATNNSVDLINKTYVGGKVDTITYATGDQIKYQYDSSTGKVTDISFKKSSENDFTSIATYEYSGSKLTRVVDHCSDRITNYDSNSSYTVIDAYTGHDYMPQQKLYSFSENNGGTQNVEFVDWKYTLDTDKSTNSAGETTRTKEQVFSVDEVPMAVGVQEGGETTYFSYPGIHNGPRTTFTSNSVNDAFGRISSTSTAYQLSNNQTVHSVDSTYQYCERTPESISISDVDDLDWTTSLLDSFNITSSPSTTSSINWNFYYDYVEGSNLVKSIKFRDMNGTGEYEGIKLMATYEYDNFGQIISEYNLSAETYCEFAYDGNGNISAKKVYKSNQVEVTEENNEYSIEPNTSIDYGYDQLQYSYDTNNPNKLVSFEKKHYSYNHTTEEINEVTEESVTNTITYDANGNLTSYHGQEFLGEDQDYTLVWDGYLLKEVQTSDKKFKYLYDTKDRLIEKQTYTLNDTHELSYKYIWKGDVLEGYQLLAYGDGMPYVSVTYKYIYNASNQVVGIIPHYKLLLGGDLADWAVNDEIIWFINDGVGNIAGMYTEGGELALGCRYNAQGNLSVYNLTGQYMEDMATSIRNHTQDPLLAVLLIAIAGAYVIADYLPQMSSGYRSCTFDTDTGLVFMNGRVYSSYFGRYLDANPESLITNKYSMYNANVYSFANNNAVNLDVSFHSVFDKGTIEYAEFKNTLWMKKYF